MNKTFKPNYYERLDMVGHPEWQQAIDVAKKYVEKKLKLFAPCEALNERVFGMPAAEHFVLGAFDKLFTGEWEWSAHRAVHTQLVGISLSDIRHHLRDWQKQTHLEWVQLDERMADRMAEDEEVLDFAYDIAEKAVKGDQALLAYLQAMRRCNNYEEMAKEMGIGIQQVYQLQRKLIRRIKKRRYKA